jgi:hypothetical protein
MDGIAIVVTRMAGMDYSLCGGAMKKFALEIELENVGVDGRIWYTKLAPF